MSKLSTKLKQKQSIVPQQIIKSRLLELSIEELEKDLEQASIQIDMLDMIYKRMTGNLSHEEEKFFSENIHALKMNYAEQKNDPNEKNSINSTNNQKGTQS